jgi:alanyl-tRNA synthetase
LARLEELIKDLKPTELIYWQDSYAKAFQASLIRSVPDEKGRSYLILDRTVFHPKSGGQPSDKGRIYGSGFEIEVKKAMLSDAVVIHYGKVKNGVPKNEVVTCEIDWHWRYLLMRRHTGGHLFDHCLAQTTGKRVETTDSWLGDDCYVGYRGEIPSNDLIKGSEKMANEMIRQGAPVHVEIILYDQLIREVPDAPNVFRLPKLDRYRIVQIEGCKPIPCGGTHIRNIAEIGVLQVKSFKPSELGFRVYYDVT